MSSGRPLVRPASAHPRRALERKLSDSGIPVPPSASSDAVKAPTSGKAVAASKLKTSPPPPAIVTSAPSKPQRTQSMVSHLVSPRTSPPERRPSAITRPRSATSSSSIEAKRLTPRSKAARTIDQSVEARSKATPAPPSSSANDVSGYAGIKPETVADWKSQVEALERTKQSLEASAATKDDVVRHLQQQIAHLQSVLTDTQKICAKFQGDCNTLADKALVWKKKYEDLVVEHEALQDAGRLTVVSNSWDVGDDDDDASATIVERFRSDDGELASAEHCMPGHLQFEDDDNDNDLGCDAPPAHELQIQALKAEVASLRAVLPEAKVRELENELRRFKQHIVHLSNDHDEQVAELQLQLAQRDCTPETTVTDDIKDGSSAQRKYEHVRKQLNIARNVIRELQGRAEIQAKCLQDQTAELRDARVAAQEVAAKTALIVSLQGRCDSLLAELARAQKTTTASSPTSPLVDVEVWQQQYRGVAASLKKQQEKYKRDTTALQQQLQALQHELGAREPRNDHAALTKELDDARRAYGRVQESLARHRFVRANLRRRNSHLERSVLAQRTVHESLASARKALATKETELRHMERKAATIERVLNDVRANDKAATGQQQPLKVEALAWQREAERAAQEVSELQSSCAATIALHAAAIMAYTKTV
ncbi:hypothetical protein SPRG_14906 [Saprolegnia parasitica CBS 223.65]|uniref:Uncharacterized protein n=1 Tax=Saprolegnia parasitica (strain CBS 223.65) TaxID=695850 RepID=A0A067BSR9_SAPPC|nr:hypothetical protein SPRG_14906 [Saprolegnia parasitica CBS 223.65]KDO19875.1 hypothetical protein SPRG_14906 [Saprolegnia parasitica CBS 223.65]|eukprot:XP_012209432.1 hypothetical protein SPRG_14906 [Saprolegnia parasitica CBS 223.65]